MITQFMTDHNVFGREFAGDSWNAWKALLSGFYGETCTDIEMFFALTQRPPEGPYNELWLVIGRRGGKSNAAALIAVYEAFLKDHRGKLARGEMATVMVVAADRRQARTIFRYIKGLVHANPMLSKMVANEKDTSIELTNRCVIEIGTANNRALRGYTISCAILDEIAFWNADGMSPDAEIVRGIRPALATLGGPLIALSSPYARRGVLWNTYKKHFAGNGKVLVAQAASQTMNPTLSQEYIDDAYNEDNAGAAAEFGAEFRRDIEGFTSIERVEGCVASGIAERFPDKGQNCYGFVDPSGGSKDAFTLAIAHREKEAVVIDCIREVTPPFSPEGVVYDFAETLKRYGINRVVGDRYAGEWPREQFRKYGITYDPSAEPKSYLYQNLLPVINSQKVLLLDNERLINQLVSLERRTSRGGRDIIDHPPNGHDDIANAVAGVVSLLTTTAQHQAGKFVLRI
jgi:hypothetical protein